MNFPTWVLQSIQSKKEMSRTCIWALFDWWPKGMGITFLHKTIIYDNRKRKQKSKRLAQRSYGSNQTMKWIEMSFKVRRDSVTTARADNWRGKVNTGSRRAKWNWFWDFLKNRNWLKYNPHTMKGFMNTCKVSAAHILQSTSLHNSTYCCVSVFCFVFFLISCTLCFLMTSMDVRLFI